jgi:NADPH2:quinone reductase
MELRDVPPPTCPADAVVVAADVAGVNFIDTYERSGIYPADFPLTPGREGCGTVVEVGSEVSWAQEGQRVAWTASPGSYAERVVVRREDFYPVPDAVSSEIAAAALLQGLTAHLLSRSVCELGPSHTALIHAGAGGVGLLLTQFAHRAGARVITTVSTEEKSELSRAAGADHVIRYDAFTDLPRELPAAVRSLTDGEGVHVVYDGVGKTTFDASLHSIAPRGMLVLFGGASGQVPPFDLQLLARNGSLTVTRPSMGHFLRTPEERAWRSGELFDAVASGDLRVRIGARYPLADAADAHKALQGRQTTGKVLLTL